MNCPHCNKEVFGKCHNVEDLYEEPKELTKLELLQADNERLKEWKKAVLGKIKRWPIYDAGKWTGDKEGWGHIFELIGWSEQERTKLQAENEWLKAENEWLKRRMKEAIDCLDIEGLKNTKKISDIPKKPLDFQG